MLQIKRLLCVLMLLCLPVTALGEVYLIADETGLPEDWAQRDVLRVVFIDMDRSDAILLQCGGESMLVDGGLPLFHQRLFNVLEEYGLWDFKYLYNTHCDGDHSGGLSAMLNSGRYTVGEVLSPNVLDYNDEYGYQQRLKWAVENSGTPYRVIDDGDVITLGGATLHVIRCSEQWGQNNRSAMCRVDFGGSRILLTGDVGNRAMTWLAENRADMLDADILKAPHHGLDYLVPAFRDAISPLQYVVTNRTNNESDKFYTNQGALFAGDGNVLLETDGVDYYLWQQSNRRD